MRLLPLLVLLLAVAAPARAATGEEPPAGPVGNAGLYLGTLPCADCPGIRYRLHLRPGRVYVLETEYLGRGGPRAVLGAWAEAADAGSIELRRPGEAPLRFEVLEPGVLRLLGADGRPIDSKLDYALRRSLAVERFQPRLRLQGLYTYMADAGLFRECVTGARFPVAQVADNVALERGYAAARDAPGAEVLVEVEGHIAVQPSMEGDRLEDALVVERFAGAFPGETCGTPLAPATLADTYWKLTRLGDAAVQVSPEYGEPHIVLRSKGNEVSGFAGCNRFMGTWRQDGERIDLGRVASTMMACRDRMEQEQAFLEALRSAERWRVTGSHLELYDAVDRRVARLEARPLE